MKTRAGLGNVTVALFIGGLIASCQPKSGDQKTAEAKPSITIQMAEPDEKALTIAGKDFKFSEILSAAEEAMVRQYGKVNEYVFTVKEGMIRQYVQNYIISEEAKKKNLSKEKFLETVVYGADLKADPARIEFLKSRQPNLSDDQIKEMVLVQTKREKEKKFIDGLQSQYPHVIHITRPLPAPVTLNLKGAPSKGNPNAPITLAVFSDFECPFCARFKPTVYEVMQKYGDQVRLVWKNFPLSFHPKAQKAAEAAMCANEQGKFWEYHDKLFDSKKLEEADLIAQAKELKLNESKFKTCLTSNKFKTSVEQDLKEGQQAGVTGTPALFVNGILLSGAQPAEEISRLVDQVMTKPVKQN